MKTALQQLEENHKELSDRIAELVEFYRYVEERRKYSSAIHSIEQLAEFYLKQNEKESET